MFHGHVCIFICIARLRVLFEVDLPLGVFKLTMTSTNLIECGREAPRVAPTLRNSI